MASHQPRTGPVDQGVKQKRTAQGNIGCRQEVDYSSESREGTPGTSGNHMQEEAEFIWPYWKKGKKKAKKVLGASWQFSALATKHQLHTLFSKWKVKVTCLCVWSNKN